MQNLIDAFNQQDYALCVNLSTQILQKDSTNPKAWFICAMSLYHLGDIKRCVEYLECAFSLDSKDEDILINLAEMYRKQGFYEKSIAMYEEALPSENVNIYYNLGVCYALAKDFDKAKNAYEKALSLNENDKDVMFNLANIYAKEACKITSETTFKTSAKIKDSKKNLNKAKIAINLYKKCQRVDALCNLASFFILLNQEKEGLKELEKINLDFLESSNEDDEKNADFFFNYANMALFALDFIKAKNLYKKAINLCNKPAFSINYAHLLLSLGEFKEGFRFYQERLKLPKIDKNITHFFSSDKHIWLYENSKDSRENLKRKLKNSKVLIFYEQGFGDSIMFGRFIDKLECKQKFIYVQEELRALFSLKFNCVNSNFSDYDYCVSMHSLPYLLDIGTLKEIKNNEKWLLPYFKNLDSSNLDSTLKSKSNRQKLRIGIFFHTNSNFAYAKEKSICLEEILSVFKGIDSSAYEITCLQPENLESFITESTPKSIASKIKTKNLQNFLDTALVMQNLDLIISVDSAVAHLAIAIGKPCFVLVHKKYDWRWGKLGKIEFEGTFGGKILAQSTDSNINHKWKIPLKLLRSNLLKLLES